MFSVIRHSHEATRDSNLKISAHFARFINKNKVNHAESDLGRIIQSIICQNCHTKSGEMVHIPSKCSYLQRIVGPQERIGYKTKALWRDNGCYQQYPFQNTLIPGAWGSFCACCPRGSLFAAINDPWFTKSVLPAIPPFFKTQKERNSARKMPPTLETIKLCNQSFQKNT